MSNKKGSLIDDVDRKIAGVQPEIHLIPGAYAPATGKNTLNVFFYRTKKLSTF
jgi:hypothetical protein